MDAFARESDGHRFEYTGGVLVLPRDCVLVTTRRSSFLGLFALPMQGVKTMRNRSWGFLTAMIAAGLVGCDSPQTLTAPSAVVPRLMPVPTPVGRLSGEFTLTLTPDAACDSLPNELRTRTYTATLTVNPYWHAVETYYDILISVPTFLEGFDSSERFYVAETDDDASFRLGSLAGQPAFVERLSATEYFAIGGSAEASLPASAASFDASMDGYVEYCLMKASADAPVHGTLYDCASDRVLTRIRCESTKHRLHWDRP